MNEPKACMSESAMRRNKWYRNWRFPLVPVLSVRSRDKHNTADFSFHWLALRVRSMMTPEIGLEAYLDDQDIVAKFRLPYLFVELIVPIFPRRWAQKTWRITRIKDWDDTKPSTQWRDII